MVVSPSAASCFVRAHGQLRYIRRNVQRRDAKLFVLCFDGSRRSGEKNRNEQQPDGSHVETYRQRLTRAEVFILRPDVFHFYWANSRRQGRLLRGREKILDAGPTAAKIRSPGSCQVPVYGSFRSPAEAQKFLKVFFDARTEGCLREGCIFALGHFNL